MKRIINLIIPMLLWSADLFAQTKVETPGYGWLLLKTTFVLIGICLLAFVGLKYLSRVNLGAKGPMKILGRLPIENRRSVFVIDIAGKTLIVGTSEAGMQTLGELSEDEREKFNAQQQIAPAKRSFKEILNNSSPEMKEEKS